MMGVGLSKCPNCSAPLKVDRQEQHYYCEYCGARIFDAGLRDERDTHARKGGGEASRGPVTFCRQCGGEMDAGAAFCPACGTAIGQAARPIIVNVMDKGSGGDYTAYPYRSRWAAFFLCLLFGTFGAHRFYVGKTGTGILWLMTFGLFSFGYTIDLILILFGAFRDKAGWPLR